jgi:hypothetical protein
MTRIRHARYVNLDEVEALLRADWMVEPPFPPHPVLDWYRILVVKLCNC